MVPVLVSLAIVAVVGVWISVMYRRWVAHPIRMAFGATAAAVFFAVTGMAGYTLSKRERFVTQSAWADHVIWWQIGIGVLSGCAAVYLWRRALDDRRA